MFDRFLVSPRCGVVRTPLPLFALAVQGAGVLEGFQLLLKYDYIKGIFAMSCLFMVEVTILDYTMKVSRRTERRVPPLSLARKQCFSFVSALYIGIETRGSRAERIERRCLVDSPSFCSA